MDKCKRWEFISIVSLFASAILWLFHSFNRHLLGGECILDYIYIIIIFLAIVIFAIAYALKMFLHKEKWRRWLQLLSPIVLIGFTALYVNGADGSNFMALNILGWILLVLIVGVYNVYFLTYYGKGHTPWVTWILYIVTSVWLTMMRMGISYLHNFLLACLLPAIAIGYVEEFVKGKIKSKMQANSASNIKQENETQTEK